MHTWDLTHSLAGHDLFIRGMRLADRGGAYCPPSSECGMSHVCQHDSFVCRKWLIHVCDMSHSYVMTIDIRVTCRILTHMWWLLGLWDMSHSYVWHDLYLRVTWLIRTCDMTDTVQKYVGLTAFMCVTWRIHMCDMTHSYVWHDSSMRATYSRATRSVCMTYSCVQHDLFLCWPWLIHMCDMTHSYVWHDSQIEGAHVAGSADIFSLGIVIVELFSTFGIYIYIYIYTYICLHVYIYEYIYVLYVYIETSDQHCWTVFLVRNIYVYIYIYVYI